MNLADARLKDLQLAVSQGRRLRESFQANHNRTIKDLNATDLGPKSQLSASQYPISPVVYDYPNIQIASLYCCFWAISTANNRTIIALESKVLMLTTHSPSNRTASEHTDNLVVATRWANSNNTVLLQRRAPPDLMKPLWQAERVARARNYRHSYLAENEANSREICKSVEYMANDPFLGFMFLITALNTALRALEDQNEVSWIMKALDTLGQRIAIARNAVEVVRYQQPVRTGVNPPNLQWHIVQTSTTFQSQLKFRQACRRRVCIIWQSTYPSLVPAHRSVCESSDL